MTEATIMTAKIVLVAAFVSAHSGAALPPLLRITSISPSTPTTCAVTLENQHSSAAIAWVLSNPTGYRTGSDVVLMPEVAILPGRSQQMLFPCEGAQTPLVTVAAVQYDDGGIAGDVAVLEESIQAPRRKQAEGFAELAELIASARTPEGDIASVPATMSQLINEAIGPSLSPMVKQLAQGSLERIQRRTPATMSTYVRARDALALELKNHAALLRKLAAQ
jgi:hypothetical protein